MLAKIRVKVAGSGTDKDPFHVELPTYSMIPGTEEHKDPEKKILVAVQVQIPADEVDDKGNLKQDHIRKKYRGKWGKFKASKLKPKSRRDNR